MTSHDHPPQTSITVRVRYSECDPMGVVHHAVYPIWMELARTDLLRLRGTSYRELEASGVCFVVARMSLRYRRPARYDDELTVTCRLDRTGPVKVDHVYEIHRGDELLLTAETTLVCTDAQGRPQAIPDGTLGQR